LIVASIAFAALALDSSADSAIAATNSVLLMVETLLICFIK